MDAASPDAADWHPLARERVEALCRGAVTAAGVDGAGVSLITRSGSRATVCATDEQAAQIEDWQFTFGEGPCVDAATWRSPVLVDDLTDPTEAVAARWPAFLPEAASIGVHAAFAFPLRIGAIALGAMDLYRMRPGGLSARELEAALLAADAIALTLLDLGSAAEPFVDNREARASYRLEVHAAAGMMSVQLGVPIEEALVHLRAAAWSQGRSINDVAADVVSRRVRYPQEEP